MIGPSQTPVRGPAPLELQVVLKQGLRLPGLWTRKGAKHAPHDQRGMLGADPGRGSIGAAPVAIMAARKRRLAPQRQLVAEDGAHFGEEAIRAMQNSLRTRVKRRDRDNSKNNWRSCFASCFCGVRTVSNKWKPPARSASRPPPWAWSAFARGATKGAGGKRISIFLR